MGRAIPVEEYPAGFVFYKMRQADSCRDSQQTLTCLGVGNWWSSTMTGEEGSSSRAILPKHCTSDFRHVPDAFGRLLAKIGYGQVLTQLDPSDFRPICLPYILGREANVSYVVGGTFDDQAPQSGIGYSLETAGFGTVDRVVLVALIRLLANTWAPAYHVVVGDVVGVDSVRRVAEKLEIIVEPLQSGPNATPGSHPHWVPK